MVCEFEGCGNKLDSEYWEDYGKMLCERHSGVDDEEHGMEKAQRRMTRFIDLSQFDEKDDEEDEDDLT